MRDYPNGGFFFIDAAPIQAAGVNGLKIDGIYEDAKRAIAGGKVFVLSNYSPEDGTIINGVMATIGTEEGVQAMLSVAPKVIAAIITSGDVISITES